MRLIVYPSHIALISDTGERSEHNNPKVRRALYAKAIRDGWRIEYRNIPILWYGDKAIHGLKAVKAHVHYLRIRYGELKIERSVAWYDLVDSKGRSLASFETADLEKVNEALRDVESLPWD